MNPYTQHINPFQHPYLFLLRKWHQIKKAFYARHNPVKLTKLRYREVFGVEPDLEHPQTFNEKVLWMKLFSDTSRWVQLADKFRVRAFVKERGLGNLLNDLYGVWKRPDEIDFATLPDSFVLKTNNGCGDIIVVKEKSQADLKAIRRQLRDALHRHFGLYSVEHHYLSIEPRIVAERLFPVDPALGSSIVDYKFYCTNGEVQCCAVNYDRHSVTHASKVALYHPQSWTSLDKYATDKDVRHFPRPVSLETMIDAAQRLSKGFPLVRVDLYEVEGQPVFGEMTFAPAAGMSLRFSRAYQYILGRKIILPSLAQEP